MICDIECFGAEMDSMAVRFPQDLLQGHIERRKSRPVQYIPSQIAIHAGRRQPECFGIEPTLRIAQNDFAPRIGDEIGSLADISRDASAESSAVESHRRAESGPGLRLDNTAPLPPAQHSIQRVILQ